MSPMQSKPGSVVRTQESGELLTKPMTSLSTYVMRENDNPGVAETMTLTSINQRNEQPFVQDMHGNYSRQRSTQNTSFPAESANLETLTATKVRRSLPKLSPRVKKLK